MCEKTWLSPSWWLMHMPFAQSSSQFSAPPVVMSVGTPPTWQQKSGFTPAAQVSRTWKAWSVPATVTIRQSQSAASVQGTPGGGVVPAGGAEGAGVYGASGTSG